MNLAGYVLQITAAAVALHYAARLFMAAPASWGRCFAAAALWSLLLVAVGSLILIDPTTLPPQRFGSAFWFVVGVVIMALAVKLLLRGEDRQTRPGWAGAVGIGSLAQAPFSLVDAALGDILKVRA